MMQATDSDALARPTSPLDLFLTFQSMSLQGFGGVLTVAQRVLCEQKRWLTASAFAEEWAVSQVLPGPNVVNLAIILGDRYFGMRGVLSALSGLFLAPLFILSTLAVLYSSWSHLASISGAVKGMGAVAAGMIGAVGLKLLSSVKSSPMGSAVFLGVAVLSFVIVAWLRLPLLVALAGVGLPSIFWAHRQLKKRRLKP